ncbi:HrgA protein [Entomomonas moraniae]|uniref:HrgA protein n=1 Tax=Entomomonas moraniae TaxID=2213226 RepID=A0A3S9XAF1_9GAMM|nr:HrgA protein [Entomomonas moraniae]AZS49432.1 HrgA protein [Entomomonas moraniae]
MSRLSQTQKIANWLMENPNQKFTAREIAQAIIKRYPEDYQEKRLNDRFVSEQDFIQQIVAEIGAQKDQIIKKNKKIRWQDKPKPRVYWFDDTRTMGLVNSLVADDLADIEYEADKQQQVKQAQLTEHDLYPLLIRYLASELKLYSMRIDEKRSSNRYGMNANKWLHPDIVAMEPIAETWDQLVRTCVLKGDGQSVRLWSFEVKRSMTRANVREYFFQAVSNSTWANEGYLVCTSIAGDGTEDELRMLSALHGIGVIVLNTKDLSESEILIPARAKTDIDWQTVNRLVVENGDMKEFVDLVSNYYETGRLRTKDWNK